MKLFENIRYYIYKKDIPAEEIKDTIDIDKLAVNNGIITFALYNCDLCNNYWVRFTLKNNQNAIVMIKHPELWEEKIIPDENDGIQEIKEIEKKVLQLSSLKNELISYFGLEDINLE